MSGYLPDDLWSSQLSSVPPRDLLPRLTTHLQKSTTFQDSLADYFKARAVLEGEYVASLQKLSRKVDSGGGSGGVGGGEGKLWERIMGEVNETAAAHSNLADTLTKDFESPLRSMPSRLPPWTRISSLSDRASKSLKAYESSSEKALKAQKKGGSKLQMAQNDLQNQTTTLAGLLPTLIETQQALTLARLGELKELAVRFETVTSEMGNRRLKGSEGGMERALGWEIEEEVRGLPVKFGGSAAPGMGGGGFGSGYENESAARGSSVRRSTMNSDNNAPSTPSSYRPSPSPRPSTSNLPQAPIQTPSQKEQNSSSLTSTLKSKFSRKSSLLSGGFGGMTSASSGGGGTIGRGRSESNATVRTNATGARTGGAGPMGGYGGYGGEGGGQNGRRDSGDDRSIAASGIPAGNIDSDGFRIPPENRDQAPWERPTNGAPRNLLDDDDDEEDSVAPLPSNASGQAPPKLNMSLAPLPIEETEAQRQAALDKVQNTLLARPPSAGGRKGTIRGRRDVRNTTFGTPTSEGGQNFFGDGSRSMDSPVQEVLASPTGGSFNLPQTGGAAGGQVGALAAQLTGNNSAALSSPTGSMNPFDYAMPATSGPGLRATMTETVNIVSKSGLVQRAMITGEVAVTLRDLSRYAPANGSGPLHIRLDEFEQLEKVAPNPKYLSQVPDKPGEYYLNLEVLANATASQPTRPVLFKYQLHVSDNSLGDFAAVEIHPQWKAAAGETRLVVNYKSNGAGRLSRRIATGGADTSPFGDSSVSGSITGLSFTVGLGGPEVTGVQAKPPGGTWSAESRKMVWNVPDLSFDPSSAGSAGKIVARFLTGDDGSVGQPEGIMVRWKCEGSLNSGLGLSVLNSSWEFEEVGRAVISGKYLVE